MSRKAKAKQEVEAQADETAQVDEKEPVIEFPKDTINKVELKAMQINNNPQQIAKFIGNVYEYANLQNSISVIREDDEVAVVVNDNKARHGDYLLRIDNAVDEYGNKTKALVCVREFADETKE